MKQYRWFLSALFWSSVMVCNTQAQTRNPFAEKPFMGWNSWDSYGMHPTQAAMLKNLEVMAKRLKPYGYTYFVIDAGWNKLKDAAGNISGMSVNDYSLYVANPQTFPGGLHAVADKAHALGLKFGIHIMRGISRIAYQANTPIKGTKSTARDIADTASLCRWNSDNYGVNMAKPGAQEYYDSYIKQLVDWGVDFIKADDITGHPEEIDAVVKAIRRTGKPVALSLSPGGDTKTEYMPAYERADMLRVTKDIWDNAIGIERAFAAWTTWSQVPVKTFWPDMDMIPFGHLCLSHPDPNYLNAGPDKNKNGERQSEHMSFFTADQKKTFMALRALSASPLFMGGDLPTSDEGSFDLLTNKEMLACNQNGLMAKQAYSQKGIEVWTTVSRKNRSEGWIGVFNRTEAAQTVGLTLAELGLPNKAVALFDVWQKQDLAGVSEGKPLAATISGNGVLFCRYTIKK